MDRHTTSRITDLSHLDVPEIVVDHETDTAVDSENEDVSKQMRATVDFKDGRSSFREIFGLSMDGGGLGHSRKNSLTGSGAGSALSSPSRSPRLRPHRANSSLGGAAVDLSDMVPRPRDGSHSRSGSAAGELAVEAFNDSAWGESMRRSFTTRRPDDRMS